MKTVFNEYTMNKAALCANGIQVVEHFGRFLVCKEYKGVMNVFFNTASFDAALQYATKM